MVGRRVVGVGRTFTTVALFVGALGASAAPARATGRWESPNAPALCSVVPIAAMSAAIGGPVPSVVSQTTTGTKALKVLEKQSDVALTPIFRKTSKVTRCFTTVNAAGRPVSPSGPGGPGSISVPNLPTMNLIFYNRATRSVFLAEQRNFQVESGSVPGGTGVARYVVTAVPGVGDAAFSLGIRPSSAPGLSSYDLFMLVGSTQAHIVVSAQTPDPAAVQTFAGTLAAALRTHGTA